MTLSVIERDGTRIAWRAEGEGTPVLLLHGLSSRGDEWHRVVPHLSRHHRVITVDNRGTGASDAPWGVYTFGAMARDAVAVLDAAGAERAHVVGLSLGSCLAQEMAVIAPQRLLSMVLAASNPGPRHSTKPSGAVLRKVTAGMFRDYQSFLRTLIPFTYHPATPRQRVEEDMEVAFRDIPRRRGVTGQTLGSMLWDRHRDLPSVQVPALVLHGADDLLDPVVNAHVLAERLPHAELTVLEGAGHQLFTDQEDAANEAVLAFLARHQPRECRPKQQS